MRAEHFESKSMIARQYPSIRSAFPARLVVEITYRLDSSDVI
jgi:hypothetical protein